MENEKKAPCRAERNDHESELFDLLKEIHFHMDHDIRKVRKLVDKTLVEVEMNYCEKQDELQLRWKLTS